MATRRRFEKLARRHVLPVLQPALGDTVARVRGALVIVEPVDWMLRSFVFSTASWGDSYVSAGVQPLYTPREHMLATYDIRLGGRPDDPWDGRMWKVPDDDEAAGPVMSEMAVLMRDLGLPHIHSIGTVERFVEHLPPRLADNPVEINEREDLAYGLVILGRHDDAREVLTHAERQARENIARREADDIVSEHHYAQHRRLRLIIDQLSGDPEEAVATLRGWAEQTADALRLHPRPRRRTTRPTAG